MTAAKPVTVLAWDELARFWSNVTVSHSFKCWPWHGAVDAHGYGALRIGERTVKAHRLAYSIANGETIDELHIRHACDNPPCCNPAHLLSGTAADNMADCISRGRNAFGRRVPNAKLTDEQARVIWDMRDGGLTAIAVGRVFGISEGSVRKVWYGETWKHVTQKESA